MAHRRNTEGLAIAAKGRRESTIKRVAEIKEKILSYREKSAERKATNKIGSKNSASKDSLIKMMQERVREIEAENRELKKQIEILYGQLMKK